MRSATNVVEPLTALLGRAEALARVGQLVRSERRLITLLGPAGIGKTRLALAVALRAAADVGGGVWFCDLSAARSRDELCDAIATVLAVELPSGADPVLTIGQKLAGMGDVLLVLDNLEQIADAAVTAIPCWLGMAKGARCIATSRERLRIGGELAYELDPLAEDAAVELFVERARDARDGFALRAGERSIVLEIVRRLDGVPLAIELAAAQMVVQNPAALLDRLQDRLALLDAGARTAGARNATLRGALDWSWNLLDEHERTVLAQCAAFRTGFSIEAAEAIVEVFGPAPPLLNLLRQLRDKSLLRKHDTDAACGSVWFSLLSTVHAYAGEQLALHSDHDAVLERHARFYLSVSPTRRHAAERADTAFAQGPDLVRANLLAVVERGLAGTVGRVTPAHALQALAVLAAESAVPAQLLSHFDRALADSAGVAPKVVARAHLDRGTLRLRDGQWGHALTDFRRVIEVSSDAELLAEAHHGTAQVHRQQGRHAAAEKAYRKALAHHVACSDRSGQAKVLANLGGMRHEQGKIAAARKLHDEALALYREQGDEHGAAVVLQNAGLITQEQGRLDEAEAIFLEAQRMHLALGNRRFAAIAHFDLACLYAERALWSASRASAEAALPLLQAAGDRRQASLAVSIRGACLAALGDLESARVDFDQADAQLAAMDDRLFLEVVRVQRGHLDLGLALRAYARGGARASAAHIARARERAGPIATQRTLRDPQRSNRVCDELRLAARILRKAVEHHDNLAGSLLVASDHSWLRGPTAERSEVKGKQVLRRVLAALVERRLSAPASPLARDELIRCGWPNERVASEAAINRVQVALTQLRKLGLERALVRRGDGYLLDPALPLFVIEATAPLVSGGARG